MNKESMCKLLKEYCTILELEGGIEFPSLKGVIKYKDGDLLLDDNSMTDEQFIDLEIGYAIVKTRVELIMDCMHKLTVDLAQTAGIHAVIHHSAPEVAQKTLELDIETGQRENNNE